MCGKNTTFFNTRNHNMKIFNNAKYEHIIITFASLLNYLFFNFK